MKKGSSYSIRRNGVVVKVVRAPEMLLNSKAIEKLFSSQKVDVMLLQNPSREKLGKGLWEKRGDMIRQIKNVCRGRVVGLLEASYQEVEEIRGSVDRLELQRYKQIAGEIEMA